MSMKITVFASLLFFLSLPLSPAAQEDEDAALSCGPMTCDATKQYCAVVVGGPSGMAKGHTCVDIPDATERPTCDTITIPVGSECTDTEDGVVVKTMAP